MEQNKATSRAKSPRPIAPSRRKLTQSTIDEIFPHITMLSILNIDNIRRKQRAEGNFDCFGKATAGYCDQRGCAYYSECLNICVVLRSLG